jgi:hypothetical protein
MAKLSIIIFFCFFTECAHTKDYVINISEALENSKAGSEIKFFYQKVYASVGITPSFVNIPFKRSNILLVSGNIDAEALRAREIGDKLENAMRLKPAIVRLSIGLICIKKERCIFDKDLVYAIPRGFEKGLLVCKDLELNCGFIKKHSVLAKMLDENIIDAIFSLSSDIETILCISKSQVAYHKYIPNHDIQFYHYVTSGDQLFIDALEKSIANIISEDADIISSYSSIPNLSSCKKTLITINE